jgi:hypothetical protein
MLPAVTVIRPAFPAFANMPWASASMPVAKKLPDGVPVPSIVSVPGTETKISPAFPVALPCAIDEMLPPEARLKLSAVMFTWPALPDPKVEVVMIP